MTEIQKSMDHLRPVLARKFHEKKHVKDILKIKPLQTTHDKDKTFLLLSLSSEGVYSGIPLMTVSKMNPRFL